MRRCFRVARAVKTHLPRKTPIDRSGGRACHINNASVSHTDTSIQRGIDPHHPCARVFCSGWNQTPHPRCRAMSHANPHRRFVYEKYDEAAEFVPQRTSHTHVLDKRCF